MAAGTQIRWDDEPQMPAVKWDDEQPVQQPSRAGFTGINPGDVPHPTDARTIPNPRIRNLPNPVDPSWGPGRSLYEGAKTGMTAASIPAATTMSLPALIRTMAGGTVGGVAGQKGAEALGAGEFGQEVAGDVGGIVGGGVANIDTPNLGPKARALGKLGVQEGISKIPIAGRLVRRPSLLDYINALRATAPAEPPPVYPGAPEPTASPEQLNPALVSQSRTLPGQVQRETVGPWPQPAQPIPPRQGLLLKGDTAPVGPLPYRRMGADIVQDDISAPPNERWTAGRIPPRSGLALPPAPRSALPRGLKASVDELLNEGLGGKPLKPNVPLKEQVRASAQSANLPEGFTPVQSSALKGYSYNPIKHEFESITKSGDHYIHGDVTPEQVDAFEQAPSKGKAWADLKSKSTLVAKVVNGKRMATMPPRGMRSADPNDLTPVLQESLKQAMQRKAQ